MYTITKESWISTNLAPNKRDNKTIRLRCPLRKSTLDLIKKDFMLIEIKIVGSESLFQELGEGKGKGGEDGLFIT